MSLRVNTNDLSFFWVLSAPGPEDRPADSFATRHHGTQRVCAHIIPVFIAGHTIQ